jgi:hypothetical protein
MDIFLQKWNILTSAIHPNQMTSNMTWQRLQQCLNIRDLNQYREFVLQCPDIQGKIKLTPQRNALAFGLIPWHLMQTDNRNALAFGLIPWHLMQTDNSTTIPDTQTKYSSYAHSETHKICDESAKLLKSLLECVNPI